MSCDEEVAEMAEEERRHEAERMRRKRGTIRGATTRNLNQIDVEISKSNPDTDHLSTLLELLSAKEDSLFELDRGIEQLTPLDGLEAEIACTEDYKERIIMLKSRAQRVITKKQDVNPLPARLLAVEMDTPERFSATADIVIHLLDTNDNAPKFSSVYYIARIPENSPGNSNVVSVTATDPDSGFWGEVKYSIYGSGADLFLIHSASGIIYTQPWASLDAEVKSKYNFYVKAEDAEGKYSLAEVFVTVLDLNDHPPEFNENFLEKTMIIGALVKIEAQDDDAEGPNNVIEYSIMKTDPENIFDINADTGEIKLKSYIKSMDIVQNITKQNDCTWSVVVQAQDRGSPSFSTTTVVKIDITEATQLRGPWASFFVQSRDKPLHILGMIAGVISLMVVVTVFISTIMFMRNKKSNRILPHRRIRRRNNPPVTFKFPNSGEKLLIQEPEVMVGVNCSNCNIASGHPLPPNHNMNVVSGRHWPPPPPPNAPALPPLLPGGRPGDRQWVVPTVLGTVAQIKPKRNRNRPVDSVNAALVSELKMRLDQRRLANCS